jgi:hypothetical protein
MIAQIKNFSDKDTVDRSRLRLATETVGGDARTEGLEEPGFRLKIGIALRAPLSQVTDAGSRR